MRPVRHPAKRRSSSCTTGLLPLVQDEGTLAFEGRLDLDFQIIMSVAPHVFSYVEQPETFRWVSSRGKAVRYTPDGLALTVLGRIYFEVKPEKKLSLSPDLDGKLAGIIEECAKRKAAFQIVTERHIRLGELLANSKSVWSASQGIDALEVGRALRILRGHTFPLAMQDAATLLGPRGWQLTRGLIGLRFLATDLSHQLSPTTPISRGGRDW